MVRCALLPFLVVLATHRLVAGEEQRMRQGNGTDVETPTPAAPNLPGPYDKETESEKMAFAAQQARSQNHVYHPVYAEAVQNISDAHRQKGYTTPVPTDEASMHPRDAFLRGAPERQGIDGGRSRPQGEFREMWKKREDLIGVLRAIQGDGGVTSRREQVQHNQQYLDTQKQLSDLEAKMGKPFDKAADAIERMRVASFEKPSTSVANEYLNAVHELKEAIAEGPPVPHGLYKKYIDNAGQSAEQKLDRYTEQQRRDYVNMLAGQTRRDSQINRNISDAYFSYEHDGGRLPGCAYIDGPCDHSEKDVPGAPLSVNTNYVTARSVTMSWQVPALNRAFVTGYRIMARKKSDPNGPWKAVAHSKGMQRINKKVRNLTPGTKYVIRVQALYVPAKIRQMGIAEISRQLTLYGIDSYTASRQGDKNTLIARLNRAVGEAAGPPSQTVDLETLKAVPSKPPRPFVVNTSYTSGRDTNFTISWTASLPEGSPISGYQIMRAAHNDKWGWELVEGNTGTDRTIGSFGGFKSGGVSYMIKVAGINEMGVGEFSEPTKTVASPLKRAPFEVEAPTYDRVACKGLDCGFRLRWKTPLSGGSDITSYQISCRHEGEYKILIDDTGTGDTEAVVSKLKGGVTYDCRVRAENAEGWGDVDTPSTSIHTPAGLPGIPDKPVISNVTGTTIKVTWNVPPDNGSPITGYRISMQEGGTGGFFVKVNDTASIDSSIIVTGLKTGGMQYDFKVAAYNGIGCGYDSPQTDPAQTKYDAVHAAKKAKNLANDTFVINHKLYTVRQLDQAMKLYKSRYEDTLLRFRIAKERGMKAEIRVGQLQESQNVESDISGMRLNLERTLAAKKVHLTDRVDSKARKLVQNLQQRKMDNAFQLSAERIDEQRNHYEKVIAKRDDMIDKLKDKIHSLAKDVQKEKQLRQAVEDRARSSGSPQYRNLKESRSRERDAPDVLEAMFDTAMSNGVSEAKLAKRLNSQQQPSTSASVSAAAEGAKVTNAAFLIDGPHPQDEDISVRELGSQEVEH